MIWATALVLLGHWLADFVWQPHWMGVNKSKSWWVLVQHAIRITVGAMATGLVIAALADEHRIAGALVWALLNGAAHFGIDAVTSRITSSLWAKHRIHGFFTVIGFDQFLHMVLATSTIAWLVL